MKKNEKRFESLEDERGRVTAENVAAFFAGMKKDLIAGRLNGSRLDLWNEVPTISAGAYFGDVVRDYSIDRTMGHVGVVTGVEEKKKRDGSPARVIFITVCGHTNPSARSAKTRKIEFILGTI